ncbi:MAG: class I SAM-dependent methyltransferase [Verrucomicrobia bacterium]|nr:class I SAM-dependent methyltransferase [Verrucomicrobiota bacterium]
MNRNQHKQPEQRSPNDARGLTALERKWITKEDRERSYSSHILPAIAGALAPLRDRAITRLIDLGCGFGGIAGFLGEYLGAQEAYGIDLDAKAVRAAEKRGIRAQQLDLAGSRLPFEDNFFDLVTSFGVLDYFPHFDSILREIHRVLKPGGWACISLPNLAAWHNRLSLLLGYQPRDVEVSKYVMCGVHPFYRRRGDHVVGHIHTVTAKGFEELMTFYGFDTVVLRGASRITGRASGFLTALNSLTEILLPATMAKRFIYLGAANRAPSHTSEKAPWVVWADDPEN